MTQDKDYLKLAGQWRGRKDEAYQMSARSKIIRRERYYANGWRCPWCKGVNRRDHEGLDQCDHCHSNTHTAYDSAQKHGRLFVTEAEEPEEHACWCGEPHPYYAPLERGCGGSGTVQCICGGDFCVCHRHGEFECFGCEDCESDSQTEDEDYQEVWTE